MVKNERADNDYMQRIPEPELMDAPEQARAYAHADFEEPNSLFVELFGRYFPDLRVGRILDLGCGPGDILVRFAARFPASQLAGIDGAPAMLAHAVGAVQNAGLADRVRLVCARLGQEPTQEVAGGWADAVISNSLLHHLADPETLWSAVRTYGAAGAAVLVMDLARPDSPDAARAIVSQYSGDEPEVLRRDFFHSLCAAYRTDEVRAQLEAAGLANLAVDKASDRHLIVHGILA